MLVGAIPKGRNLADRQLNINISTTQPVYGPRSNRDKKLSCQVTDHENKENIHHNYVNQFEIALKSRQPLGISQTNPSAGIKSLMNHSSSRNQSNNLEDLHLSVEVKDQQQGQIKAPHGHTRWWLLFMIYCYFMKVNLRPHIQYFLFSLSDPLLKFHFTEQEEVYSATRWIGPDAMRKGFPWVQGSIPGAFSCSGIPESRKGQNRERFVFPWKRNMLAYHTTTHYCYQDKCLTVVARHVHVLLLLLLYF